MLLKMIAEFTIEAPESSMSVAQNPTPDSSLTNVSQPVAIDRLPSPYRSEADIVTQALVSLEGAMDWAAAAEAAAPWVQAVRDNPPPFWAMESLLKEYPISSNEGLALMRLAEALLRVPDAETTV